MSKQPSNQAKRNLLRRGLAGILSLALILGLLPSSVVSAGAASWADPYVETLVDWGVMRGDINGNMAPDRSITRAEFVAMMNRAYGYTKLGGHPFTDVRVRDWYNEDIDIGYNIGYFKGTSPTTASPNDTLTREQAAVLLARNMMLQETVGETLGFSDSRSLSDWSRGLVGAAAASGIISGYDDGTFQPFRNITRGEVAAMLVRAIGTPIQTEGEHALGNVYGNVTVNTSGVKLRDGVIVGNLYLTGGIDLGDVLLENVTVLGEIIVSGGGESNSSAASILMRNVTADNMIVDSIADQFVTIRAEGVTDIPTTTVRTNAYVDDSSLPGYGLSYIELDGDEGTLLQLAGNVKEVWNKTPGSDLQVVQGSAEKITIDENATDSSVLVDGDARVDDLNLDTATTVTGTGDIGNLNVGAAGSTVEQLPDNITIRPGITADINGSDMNSTQAAESSSDPKLLAGYPAVKNIAPTSATLVFKTNKTGTIYWAISAVADGSVSEADLMEPPVYGGNVLQHGTINATAANTEFTAAVTGLTKDGSYYVTAMLVDGRDQHSPIKVTSFSTPDDTVPAFNQGYPYMSRITTENSQVTVMTNKSCLLYYALLPAGSTAPTPAEFKANAITGNLGYGTIDAVKNVTQPFQVNSTRLKELTDYTLYLWLTDYDGAQSSAVTALNFRTPDEQPPVIIDPEQTDANANSVQVTFQLNEAGTLYWAVVPEGVRYEPSFEEITEEEWLPNEVNDPENRRVQIKIENGAGNSISSGNARVNAAYTNGRAQVTGLDPAQYGHAFTMYLVAKDAAGNYSKIQKIHIMTADEEPPTVTQEFKPGNSEAPNEPPASTSVHLIFSERVQGIGKEDFLELYRRVANNEQDPAEQAAAKDALGKALRKYIELHPGQTCDSTGGGHVNVAYADSCEYNRDTGAVRYGTMDPRTGFSPVSSWIINYCNAIVHEPDKDGKMTIEFPTVLKTDGTVDTDSSSLNLNSGTTYHFVVEDVTDISEKNNELAPNATRLKEFTTQAARVELARNDEQYITSSNAGDTVGTVPTGGIRIDYNFTVTPKDVTRSNDSQYWDMLFWFDANVVFDLYSRPLNADGTVPSGAKWQKEGSATVPQNNFKGLTKFFRKAGTTGPVEYGKVKEMLNQVTGYPNGELREYAVHINSLEGQTDPFAANKKVKMTVSVISGDRNQIQVNEGNAARLENSGAVKIESPRDFSISKDFFAQGAPTIRDIPTINVGDTTADIEFQLTAPGLVYYMAIPVTSLRDDKNNLITNKEILENVVKDEVKNYSPVFNPPIKTKDETEANKISGLADYPLMLNDPDRRGYVAGDPQTRPGVELSAPSYIDIYGNTPVDRLVKRDKTAEHSNTGDHWHINLTELEANTVYLLCMLPAASGMDPDGSDDEHIICYRFTTDMPKRPALRLTGVQGTPNVNAAEANGKTAYMSYFVAVVDDKNPALADFLVDFHTIATDDFKQTSYYLDDNGKPKTDQMTVLDAMNTPLYEMVSNFKETLFDRYAKSEEKDNLAGRVVGAAGTSGSGGGSSSSYVIESDVDVALNTVLNLSENPSLDNRTFVVVAIARHTLDPLDKNYGFAAYFVENGDHSPPMLNSVSVSGVQVPGGISSGEILLIFNEPLYHWSTGNVRDPIDNCIWVPHNGNVNNKPSTAYKDGDTTYYSLIGARVTASPQVELDGVPNHNHPEWSGGPITSITIKVPAYSEGSGGSIALGGSGYPICDKDGNRGTRTAPLTIDFVVVNRGTADRPNYVPTITNIQQIINDGWALTGWGSNLPRP